MEPIREVMKEGYTFPLLSPSSINLYAQDPCLWIMKHFYGKTSSFNIHAMRGVSIEDGVNHFVDNGFDAKHRERAIQVTCENFDEKAFFYSDEDLVQKIEGQIIDWTNHAMDAIKEVSKTNEYEKNQTEVFTTIEGLPVRGFVDYDFKRLRVDLKTATKLPKPVTRGPRKGFLPSDKKANVRQQVIYRMANPRRRVALLFVSPEGSYLHHIGKDELREHCDDIKKMCKEIKKLLTMKSVDDILKSTNPKWKSSTYSMYWSDELRDLAQDLWSDSYQDYLDETNKQDDFI